MVAARLFLSLTFLMYAISFVSKVLAVLIVPRLFVLGPASWPGFSPWGLVVESSCGKLIVLSMLKLILRFFASGCLDGDPWYSILLGELEMVVGSEACWCTEDSGRHSALLAGLVIIANDESCWGVVSS